MNTVAFSLIIVSALIHAVWNFVAKRAQGGLLFFWVLSVCEIFLFIPLIAYTQPTLPEGGLFQITVSTILHVLYFTMLLYGYRVGDLSIVYPITRGIGPLLAVTGAIIIFGERPSLIAMFGTILIASGAFMLTGSIQNLRKNDSLPAAIYGLLAATCLAILTLWDTHAVRDLHIDSALFLWINAIIRGVIFLPVAIYQRAKLWPLLKQDGWKALVVGVGSPGGYLLFLWASLLSPVSYISPLRTLSILFGVFLGVNILKERDPSRRLIAALVIVIGVICLNL